MANERSVVEHTAPAEPDQVAAARQDVAGTIERARALLTRIRSHPIRVTDDEDLLASNSADLAAAAGTLERAGNARRALARTLAEARQRLAALPPYRLEAFAHVAALARAHANAPPRVEELEEAQARAEAIGQASEPLLVSPLSEDTRANQRRLLIASSIALLVSTGVVTVQKVGTGVADLGFNPGQQLWLIVAAGLACLYCLMAFLAAYRRDTRLGEVAHAGSASRMRVVLKRLSLEYASALQSYVDYLAAREAQLEGVGAGPSAEDEAHIAQLELLRQEIGMVAGVLQRFRSLRRVRLWMEALLPITVAVIALGVCLSFILTETA